MPPLLVRLPNHLGDACMATGALLLLARSHALTLVGRAWAGALFEAHGWPAIALGGGVREQSRRLREAVRSRPGPPAPGTEAPRNRPAAVLLTNSFSSALVFRLAGLPAVGYATDARRWLLQRAVPVPAAWPQRRLHTTGYYAWLARAFDPIAQGAAPPPELPPRLQVSARARDRARALLAEAGVADDYVVVCPVAVGVHRGRAKAWDGFAQLTDRLRATGVAVLACPGPGERAAVAAAAPAARLLPECDVGIFAALLAGSRLVIANDSGPGHLAAAVGAPLVSVFGVTEPGRTRPLGERVTIVGGPAGWPSPEAVWAAVDRSLGAAAPRPAHGPGSAPRANDRPASSAPPYPTDPRAVPDPRP